MVPNVWPWPAMTQWEKQQVLNQEILGCQIVSPLKAHFFRTRKWKMLVSARDSQTASWTSDPPYGLFSARAILSRIFLGFYGKIAVDLPHCSQVLFVFLEFLFNYSTHPNDLIYPGWIVDYHYISLQSGSTLESESYPIAGRVENPGTSNGYSPPLTPHIYGTIWHSMAAKQWRPWFSKHFETVGLTVPLCFWT